VVPKLLYNAADIFTQILKAWQHGYRVLQRVLVFVSFVVLIFGSDGQNSILILKIEILFLFSIFKILFETISIFYFQNTFKNYFANLKIVIQNSFSK